MNKFGLKIKPSSTRRYEYDKCLGAGIKTSLPNSYSLDMRKFCDIKNQHQVNSCVAFACSLVGECENYKRTNRKEEISTGNTYGNSACRKGYMGPGMYLDDTLIGLIKVGFVPNILFDVNVEMPKVYDMLKYRRDLIEQGQALKPTSFASLKTSSNKEQNIYNIKNALYTHQCPLVMVSYDFFKEPHCVVITGWDENNNFKYQNSWGIEDGEGYIPYEKIDDVCILLFDEISLPFLDVSNEDWYYQELKNAYFSGLIEGVDNTHFCPNDSIKRGDAILLIDRVLNKFEKSLNSYFKTKESQGFKIASYFSNSLNNNISFNDLNKNDYYYKSIKNLAQLGLIKGDENNNFNPENYITRAQFATVIVRLYNYLLNKIDGLADWISFPKNFGYDNQIKDYNDVKDKNSWYYNFVVAISQIGIMQGSNDNNFYPDMNITRAEAASIIERFCQKIDNILKNCAE